MTLNIVVRFFSTINELTSQYIRTELLGNSHPMTSGVRTVSVLSGGLNRFILELSDLDITNYAYNALPSGDHRPVPVPFPCSSTGCVQAARQHCKDICFV